MQLSASSNFNRKEINLDLSFHGADRNVTGSCHLVECSGYRILIDCGLFQGGREAEQENAKPFGFDPTQIDYVLLTHAHLDHCGRLPLLFKRGFRGEIITTAATGELSRIVMVDSAHIQEEEARRQALRTKHHRRHIHLLGLRFDVCLTFIPIFIGCGEQPVQHQLRLNTQNQ